MPLSDVMNSILEHMFTGSWVVLTMRKEIKFLFQLICKNISSYMVHKSSQGDNS